MFSQHPYAESFIGRPHVWTVDYNNSEEFEAALKAIMRTQVSLRPIGTASACPSSLSLGSDALLVNSDSQAGVGRCDRRAPLTGVCEGEEHR